MEKYFVVLRYSKAPFLPKIHKENFRSRLSTLNGLTLLVGNSPILNSNNFFATVDTKPPVVLGFGTVSGQTSPLSGEFVYNASYGDPYLPSGRTDETTYQANVLGAISNGKSHISFIEISTEDQLKSKAAKDRSIRSYINASVRGTKDVLKDWTILDKEIKSNQIYKPTPKRFSNNTKTKVSGWVDPLKVMNVTSEYGMRTISGETQMHQGIDLTASVGTNVYAALPGRVVFAGPANPDGYGRVVVIAHADKNISTLYGHISAEKVSVGTTVSAGDIIALSGNEGSAKKGGAHLHFEVGDGVATDYSSFVNLKKLNPQTYISFSGAAPDVKRVTPAETEDNKVKIKNYLKTKGWSKFEVAAALGNMDKETGGTFNPYSTNPKDENGYPSIGLIQWNGSGIGGGTKDTDKAFKVIGTTVDAQMNYLVEGGWQRNTVSFRNIYATRLSDIDTDGAKVKKIGKDGDKVKGLTTEQLNAYLAAFLFANIVEVCAGCNVGKTLSERFKNYHTSAKAEKFDTWERSESAVAYLNRMNNPSDNLKW
jgi:murein DD-endopeptidase MepM/ murein hydrolase activator NlpD